MALCLGMFVYVCVCESVSQSVISARDVPEEDPPGMVPRRRGSGNVPVGGIGDRPRSCNLISTDSGTSSLVWVRGLPVCSAPHGNPSSVCLGR